LILRKNQISKVLVYLGIYVLLQYFDLAVSYYKYLPVLQLFSKYLNIWQLNDILVLYFAMIVKKITNLGFIPKNKCILTQYNALL